MPLRQKTQSYLTEIGWPFLGRELRVHIPCAPTRSPGAACLQRGRKTEATGHKPSHVVGSSARTSALLGILGMRNDLMGATTESVMIIGEQAQNTRLVLPATQSESDDALGRIVPRSCQQAAAQANTEPAGRESKPVV